MRKFLLILIALFLIGSLLAVPALKVIKTHDYAYVNRTVIVFSSRAEYQIEDNAAGNTLLLKIPNAVKDARFVIPNIQGSKQLRSISVDVNKPGINISIQTTAPYRREMMKLDEDGFKIVLDIFQKNPPDTFEAGLGVANFYFSTHQYAVALPLYVNLETKYPDRLELNYYMAKDLIGLKKYSQALARLEKVPATARESQFANTLKEKIKNPAAFNMDFLDSDFDAVLSTPVQAPAQTPAQKTTENSVVTFKTVEETHPSKLTFLKVLLLAQIPLWLALVMIIVLFIIFSMMLHAKKHEPRGRTTFTVYNDTPKEPSIFVDEEAKRKTIAKLVHDGWSNKEIAKELHIPESEVESAVKQLAVSDF